MLHGHQRRDDPVGKHLGRRGIDPAQRQRAVVGLTVRLQRRQGDMATQRVTDRQRAAGFAVRGDEVPAQALAVGDSLFDRPTLVRIGTGRDRVAIRQEHACVFARRGDVRPRDAHGLVTMHLHDEVAVPVRGDVDAPGRTLDDPGFAGPGGRCVLRACRP